MGILNLSVRQAKAEDINEITIINSIGFADYMNSKMGKTYTRAFYDWFIDPQKNKDGISFVVSSGNTLAGFVVGARIGYQKYLNKQLLLPAAIGFIIHPTLLLQWKFIEASFLKIKSLLVSNKKITIQPLLQGMGVSLVGIAVHPDFRGLKAGSLLMTAFEEDAKAKKYDYMRLTVLEKNTRAIKIYTENGWKLLENEQGVCSYYKYL